MLDFRLSEQGTVFVRLGDSVAAHYLGETCRADQDEGQDESWGVLSPYLPIFGLLICSGTGDSH